MSDGKIKFEGGTIAPRENGSFLATLWHKSSRHRKVCSTTKEAKAWILATSEAVGNKKKPLTAFQLNEAQEAWDLLPKGASLTDAAKCYIQHNGAVVAISLIDATKRYLEHKQKTGRKKGSIDSVRHKLRRLYEHFDDDTPDTLHQSDIERFFDEYGIAGTYTNNYLRDLKAFFNWCVAKNYANKNPMDGIEKFRHDQKLPEVLSVQDAQALLDTAATQDPGLVPHVAVSLFAGPRRTECDGLKGAAITNVIHIGPGIAKSRHQRFLDIESNLHTWLAAYPPQEALLQPNMRKRLEEIRRRAGITTWPKGATRHSFATYHLAKYQDAAKTAFQLGHPNSTLLYTTYRNLATKDDGDAYFAISPTNRP